MVDLGVPASGLSRRSELCRYRKIGRLTDHDLVSLVVVLSEKRLMAASINSNTLLEVKATC